jgi:hypothetical protein
MRCISITLLLYLLMVNFNLAFSQAKWSPHYEDKNVKIEYKLADCNDRTNDLNFSYYVLRIENKTKSKINVQFETVKQTGPLLKEIKEENRNSFILKPSEVREGNCTSTQKELRQFVRNNKEVNNKSKDKELVILNIKTYEL